MAKKIKSYPFKCPACYSLHIEMSDSDHDDDTYTEDWQCDGCGTCWRVDFDLAAVTMVDEDA